MDRDLLSSYVEQGLSTYKIANIENKSQSTIRYWLKKYNLKTKNKSFKDGYFCENKVDINNQFCSVCNIKIDSTNGYFRKNRCIYYPKCKKCFSTETKYNRKNIKKDLVDHLGGSCKNCGYDKELSALEFHHIDPSIKEVELSKILLQTNENTIKNELSKCILLCSNCHKEEHFKLDARKQLEKEFNNFNVSELISKIYTGKNTDLPSCKICDTVLTDENIASKKHYPICKSCNSKRAMKREKDGKKRAVDYMGGKCSVCGYDNCIRALEFHHLEPNKKSKDYNKRFKVWSFDRQKEELENCIIVCSNCHREIHS